VTTCAHLTSRVEDAAPQTTAGCGDCLVAGRHDWVHLRLCVECGHVGCCDSSPGKHATGHYRSSSHPVVRSLEPGETWRWCYVDEIVM
jgi:uncharacterized UBP type Zn finger protein